MEGASLERGESVRMVCPFCNGGSSNEKSLSIHHNEDGAILFFCHRDRCGAKGKLGGGLWSGNARPERRVHAPVVVDPQAYIAISPDIAEYVRRTWHFAELPVYWKWDPHRLRVMFPVFSPLYERRGWVARSLDRECYPKTVTQKEVLDEPWLHWPESANGKSVWIVEDIPSAERLCRTREQSVCALMGTHASNDVKEEILMTARGRPIIVALDRDAVGKSIALMDELRMRHSGPVNVYVLAKDIKDMTARELTECLKNGY